jgi:hypothetical protein
MRPARDDIVAGYRRAKAFAGAPAFFDGFTEAPAAVNLNLR